MKKIILTLFMLLILCGCTANANFIVKSDKTIEEKLEITDDINNVYIDDYDSYDQYIDDVITNELGTNRLREFAKENIVNDKIGVKLSRKYESDDFCLNITNSSLSEIITDIKCEEKKGVFTISGKPNYFICTDDCMFAPEISSATINITLPIKAISDNANYVVGNKYTWHFSKEKTDNLNLKFKLEKQKILGSTTDINKKSVITIVLIIALLMVVFGFISVILYKKYKSNRLDY